MSEYITHEPHAPEAWVCVCHNTPHGQGFFPCTTTGEYVEPTTALWPIPLYRCALCDRVIHSNTLAVLAQVSA